jgi:hypothetical protein
MKSRQTTMAVDHAKRRSEKRLRGVASKTVVVVYGNGGARPIRDAGRVLDAALGAHRGASSAPAS